MQQDMNVYTVSHGGYALPTTTKAALRTLRRIPDTVVQIMATQEFRMMNPRECLCGWAVQIVDPATHTDHTQALSRLYGGSPEEWKGIFIGVLYPGNDRLIEEAFAIRVMETVP
jgi:hypothetical protein